MEVFDVLLHNRRHLLNLKNRNGWTPLHTAARWASVDVVEKFVELGGEELLEARSNDEETPLHLAALWGKANVLWWMLRVNPQLLKIRNRRGELPLDFALTKHPSLVVPMVVAAAGVVTELLEQGVKVKDLKARGLKAVVPAAKEFLKDKPESFGLNSLRLCAFFRKLTKMRPKDSLTDDLSKISNWQEALTENFCSNVRERNFQGSLWGKEREWFALLESSEPLSVVTQANCTSLGTEHWKKGYGDWRVKLAPRDVFITRVLSMLLMVAFVLLHIESIKGDSGMTMAGAWPSVWLWGAVLTGSGFIVVEIFQLIRLKAAAYWADSWNRLDAGTALWIVGFIAIHFAGWSSEAEVSSGVLIALLFALRLLQAASLHPAVGPLILAVVRMFSDISMFLCLYVYILLIFAGVFTILSSDEDHQYFGSFAKATLTLFYGGLGEFSDPLSNAIESHDSLGTVLLFIYVILSSIILASTYATIEETQTGQYHCCRVGTSAASRLPHQRTSVALCRIAFWSMTALYSSIDALLCAVAFAPAAIYERLGELQQQIPDAIQRRQYWTKDSTGKEIRKTVHICEAFRTVGIILVVPLYLLYEYVTAKAGPAENDEEDDDPLDLSGENYKNRIGEWMEAADHHDSSVPDVMTALKDFTDEHESFRTEILFKVEQISDFLMKEKKGSSEKEREESSEEREESSSDSSLLRRRKSSEADSEDFESLFRIR
ncbi:unnamed protein product [Vitrella brassicaformis CCMP3155]|uniref:Ion transport domain-containing protein n=1 Tax=Vitrella brassicaformis (strain CCMP3155) TaxID=1169540 RepID=A0A0G4EXL2_VITBC|nr:unnamed protein product [Vitrella brassicaformis CCMP3155]|eukprot:CEM03344.1 unnamed protein product [Vitrella brassicaformis CCMP3155]